MLMTCMNKASWALVNPFSKSGVYFSYEIADSKLKPCMLFCVLSYVNYYKLPQPTDNVLELLAFIAQKHNYTTQLKSLTGKARFTFQKSECESRTCFFYLLLLPTAYVVRREGYVLTRVCVCPRGGGVPRPGPARGGVPQPGLVRGGTPARSDGGYPRWGTPRQGWGPPGLMGGGATWSGVPPWQGWDTPPPPYRTTDGVLDTAWSVCLFRSRRSTFLSFRFFWKRVSMTSFSLNVKKP